MGQESPKREQMHQGAWVREMEGWTKDEEIGLDEGTGEGRTYRVMNRVKGIFADGRDGTSRNEHHQIGYTLSNVHENEDVVKDGGTSIGEMKGIRGKREMA